MERSMENEFRRRAGACGAFTEKLMEELSKNLDFKGLKVAIESFEMGPNPLNDSLTVDLRVTDVTSAPHSRTPGVRIFKSGGPTLSFTFTSERSVQENLAEFREFVNSHVRTAATAPQVTRSVAHRLTR